MMIVFMFSSFVRWVWEKTPGIGAGGKLGDGHDVKTAAGVGQAAWRLNQSAIA